MNSARKGGRDGAIYSRAPQAISPMCSSGAKRLWCGIAMPICGKITRVPELSVEDWIQFASDVSCLRSVAHSTVDNPFSPGRRLSVGVVGAFELVTRHRAEPVGAIQPGPDFESDGVLEVACIRANAALARGLAERVATGLNATLKWWG